MATMAEALNEMRADPESFLRHYMVSIAGGTPGIVPQRHTNFLIEAADDQVFRGFQTGMAGRLGKTKDRPQLRISMANAGMTAGPGQAVFDAWYIAMSDLGGGALAHQVHLSGSDGPDIALTSQLSGCTFGIGSATSDGGRLVSHIRPPTGQQPSAATYQAMRQEASFGNMDGFFDRASRSGAASYGNPENRATIIGVRQAGNWRFYAQTYHLYDRRLFNVEALNG
jgi:hypothetical protein